MKKSFLCILFLFSFFCLHAKSDIQLLTGPFFYDYSYDSGDTRLSDSGIKGLCLSAANYNFISEEEHFGFFEKASVQFYDNWDKFDFSLQVGPSFCYGMNEHIDLLTAPFLRLDLDVSRGIVLSEKYANSLYPSSKNTEYGFYLGLGADILFKFFADTEISLLAGLDISFDFFKGGFIFYKKEFYNIDFDNYFCANCCPFIGISYNF